MESPRVRFHSLDVLRGLAALAIVFRHWQHFFYFGQPPIEFAKARQPLHDIFFLFYDRGLFAVDVFFCLSGFIFFWLYSEQVAKRELSARDFAVLRFSRLYPLHLLTLVGVAILQAVFVQTSGEHFIYHYNDARHFSLQLAFASAWGLEKGHSFNGPAYTISVEIALYALFFLAARFLPRRKWVAIGAVLIGFLGVDRYSHPMGHGIGSFFLGGCMYLLYAWVVRTDRVRQALKWLPALALVLWVHAIASVAHPWNIEGGHFVKRVVFLYPSVVLFPLTVLTLALLENRRGTLGKRLSFLGDISYSTYLLHFPLQLGIAIVCLRMGIDRTIFYSPWTLGAFFALLIALSLASFRYFEKPAQRCLRNRLLSSGFGASGGPK